MVEPRRPEAISQLLRQAFVGAEHDAGEHRVTLTAHARRKRAFEPRAQPIGHSAEPAAPADDSRVAGTEHDLDSLPSQPGSLVEAAGLVGVARTAKLRNRVEDRTLRRRAAQR